MKVEGGCHCGKIRYEAEIDPAKVVICHCTDCQTLSGSAFRTVVPTNEGTFRLLSGTPKVYVKSGNVDPFSVVPQDVPAPLSEARIEGQTEQAQQRQPPDHDTEPATSYRRILV